MSILESWFFMLVFMTGFLGALVLGVVVHDAIDRNRRFLQKLLKREPGPPIHS